RYSLYRIASFGGAARKLVDDVTDGDWSPDGKHIAFVRWVTSGERTRSIVGIANADGSSANSAIVVDDVRLAHPRWSPDSKMVACVPTQATIFESGDQR